MIDDVTSKNLLTIYYVLYIVCLSEPLEFRPPQTRELFGKLGLRGREITHSSIGLIPDGRAKKEKDQVRSVKTKREEERTWETWETKNAPELGHGER